MGECVRVGATPSCGPDKGVSKDSDHWRGFAIGGLRDSISIESAMVDERISEEKLQRGESTERALSNA